jgi:hypothetical protein
MDVQSLLTALVWLAAGLLVLAGASKMTVPDPAMAALHSLHLPSGRIAARVVGLGEIGVGVGAIIVGGLPAALGVGVGYLVLLAVAARQRAAQVDCGCFGSAATPVSRLHLAINTTAAIAGLAGLAVPVLPLAAVAADAGTVGTAAGLVLLATGIGLIRTLAVRAGELLRQTPAVVRR